MKTFLLAATVIMGLSPSVQIKDSNGFSIFEMGRGATVCGPFIFRDSKTGKEIASAVAGKCIGPLK